MGGKMEIFCPPPFTFLGGGARKCVLNPIIKKLTFQRDIQYDPSDMK